MVGREWICDLVEPRKGNLISHIYDYIMLVAIAIGTAPLLFREQYPIFWYFDLISGICYIVDYLLRWMICDFRSEKPTRPTHLSDEPFSITPDEILCRM